MIFLSIASAILLLNGNVTGQFDDPQQYAATAVPKNPSSVRQALGYNKYDGREVKNSDKSVLYGNNWELFDNGNLNRPQNPNSFGQNPYYGNQNEQPYSKTGVAINYASDFISWLSKRQAMTAMSATEAELVVTNEAVKETVWFCRLFEEMF
ncbi:hypothetical protein ILUMI_05045 [Ignelater luminosus]|uniref:Uncharacterized protein n=1 Tax=Ignelater luminosus TaxID=2038154 RepID=A0A8K0GJ09_IGNLU|nr:hypothetical protein ILUMI_05045 [Ignelater luminosus]